MIKFFRKIRQNLLSEGKTGKYFKYAIGEILLVVIGILIALQINNWNQERLKEKQIFGYLMSMTEDLKSDISQYEGNIIGFNTNITNNSRVLKNDDYKKLEVDSINILIMSYWNLNRTSDQTFQKIKNTGLQETLGTPEINKAVSDYYNIAITHYDYFINWAKENSERDSFFWSYNTNWESGLPDILFDISELPFKDNSEKRKEDLIKITESTEGRNYLRQAIGRDTYGLNLVKNIKENAEELLKLIENELKK
ncbi:DUF6090 family protein [Muriicola sp. E247]|uniref:DUF6090 family protein n=1 Tax=Muriicola sp. E247 TaxID=3242730 RepID=UPI0035256F9D